MPPSGEMIGKVRALLDRMPLSIISGRDFDRIEPGFLPILTESPNAGNLFVFPESSARGLRWQNGAWAELYGFHLSPEERAQIHAAIEESIAETGVLNDTPVFGERYLEKPAQTAYAMLGLQVPRDLKYSWDPGNAKRKKFQAVLAEKLPDFEVLLGGATSIDVTKQGVDKRYGVRWFSKALEIPVEDMLYVGDALEEGGNDYVVIETGIATRATSGPEETLRIIDEILEACSAA